MLKINVNQKKINQYIRTLGVAGLTTLGSSQLSLAAGQQNLNSVLWSPDRDNQEVRIASIKDAARAMALNPVHQAGQNQSIQQIQSQPPQQSSPSPLPSGHPHPIVRFTSNGIGGTALVPLWAGDASLRCSPNFDLAPFQSEKGLEIWAKFAFLNIDPEDRNLIAFGIKADKPGCKDRYRTDHLIGHGNGTKSRDKDAASMTAMLAVPSEGDYGYYFVDQGVLSVDDLVDRNPEAAIRITISNHAPGREA